MIIDDKRLRDQHQPELLDSFYNALRTTLGKFNLDLNEIYPRSNFDEQSRTTGKFAFAMATCAMLIFCKYPLRLIDDKNASLTKEEMNAVALYNQMMRDKILDLIRMEVL